MVGLGIKKQASVGLQFLLSLFLSPGPLSSSLNPLQLLNTASRVAKYNCRLINVLQLGGVFWQIVGHLFTNYCCVD